MQDINCNFDNNDLEVVENNDDMFQSALRRLSCETGSCLIYEDYGSDISNLLGGKVTEVDLQLIEQEVTETLSQDTRVEDLEVKAEIRDGTVFIDVTGTYNEGEPLELTINTEEDLE